MTPLDKEVALEAEREGPLSFARFMELALYHPDHGYYAGDHRRTGWRGDFITSSELDPTFGMLWSRAFERVWEACGCPGEFEIVEIGPGEGGFAAAVLDAVAGEFAEALVYRLVERSPSAATRQQQRLSQRPQTVWSASLAGVPPIEAGCVFANEVLDNAPVDLVTRIDGELRELRVERAEGRLTLRPWPASPTTKAWLERISMEIPEGHRAEVSVVADRLVVEWCDLFQTGSLVLVDYGVTSAAAAERPRGTLVSYFKGGVDEDVLTDPGLRDITAHVNWTSLARALHQHGLSISGPVSQAAALRFLGAGEMDAALDREHDAAVAAGDGAGAVRALARRHGLAALLASHGLGGLGVLAASKGIEPPLVAAVRKPSAP